MQNNIPKISLISYSMLAIPLAFASIPLYIHAPDFYATEFKISLGSLGLVLLFLRFIDAIQDPLIGYFSDKYQKKRHIIISLASVFLVISFIFLFVPLYDSYLLWFAVFMLFATTFFSFITINLNSLGGLWSRDKNQKTIIAGYREVFGLVGLIIAVILPSILQNYFTKKEAFEYTSYILTIILIISLPVFWYWQKNNKISVAKYEINNFDIKKIFNLAKDTKKFFLIYKISILASSIPAVLVLFFIRDRLNLEEYTGLFLLAYFLSGAIGIPIWKYLSVLFCKYQAWLIAMILAVISFIWAYFLDSLDFWQYLIICIASGIAFGAELVLPTSILADHIHGNKKEAHASFYYGILAFLAKAALALAAAISFLFLQISEFTPNTENTQESLHAISVSYAFIPCFIKLMAIYFLWRFINDKTIINNNGSVNYA